MTGPPAASRAVRRCSHRDGPSDALARIASYPWDRAIYQARNVIERMFCRLKDFRRVATRYDKRADTYLAAVLIAATVAWWLK